MYVVDMRCGVAVLFTCMLVWDHPIGNGRVECEMSGSEQTRKALMEASQQEGQFTSDSRPCRTYSQRASRRWLFKYVKIYDCVMPIKAIVVNSSDATCV